MQQQSPQRHKLNLPYFRDRSQLNEISISFAYNSGGIGDYIHWTTALQWIIETHNYISGRIVAPGYFVDLARLWFGKYSPRYEVIESNSLESDPVVLGLSLRVPSPTESINACGFHMLQLGFGYYAGIDLIPTGWAKLPEIRGDEADVTKFGLPENYAVVTTEATSETRRLPAKTINEITDNLIRRGVTPVFLGRSELAKDYRAKSVGTLSLHGIVDLREKTNLVEAAVILSRAKFVLGLDNGLLHLACCSNVPVIFAFTTVDPRHRLPPRLKETKTLVIVPKDELKCRFCQSNMRFLIGHHFDRCLYGDSICCAMIRAKDFISAVDTILSE